ncbi:MAG: cation:dicarboxylase symporter family transporter [Lachnospiraceae bacterium]|nr:cation:dicarboxylase symporter family transporter [Lachnospiraceae bacterium]
MKKLLNSLPFRLLLGVVLGILAGQIANESVMNVVVTVKYILNQVIVFCVPLIIIGFIAPSITKLGSNASKILMVAVAVKASVITAILDEFQKMILLIVTKLVIPILPIFIGFTFCSLSYEGTITKQFPVFIEIIVIVLVGHYIWMAVLYGIAGLYSKKNPIDIVKNYGPAYLTAVGTMSSAATLAVALRCAKKSVPPLREDMVDFGIPLFANIHLCGSVLTEVFFVMTVSRILYGSIPSLGTMVLFCVLLGIFAIGAPGVPGGTVVASLGLISGVLGFGEDGLALMLTIFALQDSFGTACNVTGDGALTLILSGYADKHKIEHAPAKTV